MNNKHNEQLATILGGCLQGKRESQNELYRLYYAYVMSICLRYFKNEKDAVVVLNDVFFKVFQNLKSFNLERPFKPWLRAIIINTSLNHLRRQHKNIVDIETIEHIKARESILSALNHKDLTALIQSLSFSYKTVFNLHAIDGYSHEEIAELLGISTSTSRANLSRARLKLRELVNEQNGV